MFSGILPSVGPFFSSIHSLRYCYCYFIDVLNCVTASENKMVLAWLDENIDTGIDAYDRACREAFDNNTKTARRDI